MKSEVAYHINSDNKIEKGEAVFLKKVHEKWFTTSEKVLFQKGDFYFYGDLGTKVFKTRKAAKEKIEKEESASLVYYQRQLEEAQGKIKELTK